MSIFKGLLQDEDFLIGAGLLSAGSQGQSVSQGLMASLNQAAAIKKLSTPKDKQRRIIKGNDGFQYYADTGERVLPDVKSSPKERKIVKAADGYNYYADNMERVFPDVKKEIKPENRKIVKAADGYQYYADTGERVFPNVKGTDKSQMTYINPDTGEVYTGSVSGFKLKEKNQINNTEKANILQSDYNILQSNIKDLQEKVTKTPTGAYGKVVSGFNIVADQFAQIKDFNVDNKFAKNASKDVDSFLNSKGITKDAQNYAQIRSSITNLAYVLAKIAEPGNPKYSEGDIKRQFDRIAWGGSRDQIVAGLQQVLEDEWRTASINYKRLNPKGDWGFDDPRKKSTTNNKNNNNTDNEEDNDPLGLRDFL